MISRAILSATLLLSCGWASAAGPRVDAVKVIKSQRKLLLLKSGKVVAEYRIALGAHPKGHKERHGDERTPEGAYVLDYKNPNSSFFKSIHVSYPNPADVAKARKLGVDPGGNIMIHGQKNGLGFFSFLSQNFDWTDGCIALSNEDMQEVWDRVLTPTPIEIAP